LSTYTFQPDFAYIATEALDVLQISQDGESLDNNHLQRLRRAYNSMVKGWQTQGMLMWAHDEGLLFLQKGSAKYDLSQTDSTKADYARIVNDWVDDKLTADSVATDTTITVVDGSQFTDAFAIGIVLDSGVAFWTTINGAPAGNVITLTDPLPSDASTSSVVYSYDLTAEFKPISRMIGDEAFRRLEFNNDNYEVICTSIDRVTYFQYPDKNTQAAPQQVFYARKDTMEDNTSQFYVWNTPDSGNYGLRFSYDRQLRVIETKEDLIDFPDYWTEAIIWNLAQKVKTRFGCSPQLSQEIDNNAALELNNALNYETPVTDIVITMDDY